MTKLPLLLSAAKAPLAPGKIFITPEFTFTEELSPPYWLSPHVITLPSLLSAAKALSLEEISITPEFILFATEEISFPKT